MQDLYLHLSSKESLEFILYTSSAVLSTGGSGVNCSCSAGRKK